MELTLAFQHFSVYLTEVTDRHTAHSFNYRCEGSLNTMKVFTLAQYILLSSNSPVWASFNIGLYLNWLQHNIYIFTQMTPRWHPAVFFFFTSIIWISCNNILTTERLHIRDHLYWCVHFCRVWPQVAVFKKEIVLQNN